MPKFIFYQLRLLLLATLVVSGPGSAQAVQPVNEPQVVSPDVLINEVLDKNPELALYRAEIEAAKGARKTAKTLSNPEFSGSLGRKRVWDEEDELTGEGATGEASVMQSFEWPGRIGLRRAIADRDIELAELGLEQFRAALAGQAKSAIYDAAAAHELAATTREVADHFRSLREVLVQRDPAGLTPLLETRAIEAMELTMQRKAGEAAIAAQAALFRLNRLRGATVDAELSLDRRPLSFQPLEKDRRTLAALASANDFSVRLRELELARQDFRVDLAGNEQFPAVAVGPSFSQEKAGDRERVIGVALSVPLPLWNQNQGSIETAKAQKTQAETSLDIARHEAERRAVEAAVTYDIRFKEMAAWRPDPVRHFKEAAELADRHYRLGAVPVSIYLELQTQYLEAVEGLQNTKREAFEAAMELELLTQTPLGLIGAPAGADYSHKESGEQRSEAKGHDNDTEFHHHDEEGHGEDGHEEEGHEESPSGASFKAGRGITLTEETRKILGVETADVVSGKLPRTARFNVQIFGETHRFTGLDMDHTGCDVHGSGFLSEDTATLVKPRQKLKLTTAAGEVLDGVVAAVQKTPALGEAEVVVGVMEAADKLKEGEFVTAAVSVPRDENVLAIPASALLRTSEGVFVYAVNGHAYRRTAVQPGSDTDGMIEIIDGLFSGDKVVTTPVETLWLIELRATKGGGHSH